MKTNGLRNIQALRFFAALSVFLFHARDFQTSEDAPAIWANHFFQLGFAGVDLFFVISGFVLWTAAPRGMTASSSVFYLLKRFWRIFSGYWPFFVIALLVFFTLDREIISSKDLFNSFFLLPLTPVKDLLIPVSWTLGFELYFYSFFALLLRFSTRNAIILVWAVFFVIATTNLYYILIVDQFKPENWVNASAIPRFFFSPFCLEFLAGILLSHAMLDDNPICIKLVNSIKIKPAVRVTTTVLLILILFAGGYYYQVHGNLNAPGMIGAYHLPERVLFFGGASVLIVYLAVQSEVLKVFVAKSWLVALGDASYALYLSHTIGLTIFASQYVHALISPHPVINLAMFVVLVVSYSLMHYRFIENPLYVTGVKWMSR